MMGTKARVFGPLHDVSLEDLVPHDSFYQDVEAKLDLSFVRDLVKDTYSAFGRPSIDPVVFFKLQLVMFFEGLRSSRIPYTLCRRRWQGPHNLAGLSQTVRSAGQPTDAGLALASLLSLAFAAQAGHW
jgi:hypothetical protein